MSRPEPDATPEPPTPEPAKPALLAWLVFTLAAATLCWPMLAGRWLLGDDQYIAGYGFRRFGAEMFRTTGHIPEWNPYLFGGLPYVAAQHGDIFYPTAWLRWFLPIDTAMNLGFAFHLVLAGAAMYALLRGLRVGWSGAVVGGLSYEMTGIVASLVKPGHDGKLFVSALVPFAFLALLRGIRDRRAWGYGLLALVVGLGMLSPHYQMTYYLLVATALWSLWLVFLDPERPADTRPIPTLALALGAVLLGLAIAALQVLPFLAYLPYSPRGAGGPSGGWTYATGFSMLPEELFTTVLPQFNGVLQNYWGRNFFKLHTEYVGASVALLAVLGVTDRRRKPAVMALGAIAALFLLVAFGGHTPFYRVWYEVMPMMKKVRAPGMAFFLVAFPLAVFAGFGTDRVLRRAASARSVAVATGILVGLAFLGAIGALQAIAGLLATPEQAARVAENAGALRLGSIRLLLATAAAAAVLWAIRTARVGGWPATALLALVVVADLWSVDRLFFEFKPPAAELYRDDAITGRIRREAGPFRVLDGGVYQGSYLMAHDIQSVLGYHGNEVRYYDELLGGKGEWRNATNLNLLDLLSVRFLLLPAAQAVPTFRQVLGPVTTTPGSVGVLYRRDTVPPYVRVIPAAAKLAEEQLIPTIIDPRFPNSSVVVYSETTSVAPEPIRGALPPPPPVRATLAEWAPGRMRITLAGRGDKPAYLLVSETWYPDWRATVDGRPAPVHRGDYALISVVVPPGAREVRLRFHSAAYARGKLVSLLALLGTFGLLAAPVLRRRRTARA